MPNFQIVDVSDTLNVGSTNLIPFVGRELVAYDRASVPLQTMMMNLSRVEHTPNPNFFWYETQYDDPSTTCQGILAAAAGVSQTIVFNSLNVRSLDRYLDPTQDQLFLVLSVTSYDTNTGETTAVIKRVPSSEATLAVTGTPLLIRIDTQLLEGDYYPQPVSTVPIKLTNGISSISDQIAVSNIMNDTPSFYNQGSEFDFQRTAVVERFRKKIERNVIWSQYYQEQATHNIGSTSWTNTAYSGDGIINSIKTNIVPYSGPITESGLDNFLGSTVWGSRYYGSDYKVGFGGPKVFQDINEFAKNRMRYGTGSGMMYGLTVSTYMGYAGQQKVYMILEREFMNDNPSYAHSLVVIDPLHVKMMYHGTALMMIKNTTPPNQAIMSMALESRPGILLDFEKASAIYQQAA